MPSPRRKKIFLIDGTAQVYRAYFAIRAGLTAEDGTPTNATYGFTTMLRKLLKEHEPEYVGVAFDSEGPTFRHEQFEGYKAQRPRRPDDLVPQFPYALNVCEVLGIPALEAPGFEADDILGTLAHRGREAGLDVVLVASDKDMFQLVGDGVVVMNPHKGDLVLDAAKVQEVFGARPDQVTDVLALWGDASDNIPGVTGIGEKGAKQIIAQFGDLETAIARAGEIKRKSYRENLLAEADRARFSKELVTIRSDAPVELDLDALQLGAPDRGAAYALFRRLGFQSILGDYAPEESGGDAPEYRAVLDREALDELVRSLAAAGRCAVHTETTSADPLRGELVGVSFCCAEGTAWYVPLHHRYVGMPDQLPAEESLAALRPLLEDPGLEKVGHDLKTDLLALGCAGIALDGLTLDTMIASYLIDPGAKHDLDDLAMQHLGRGTVPLEEVAGKGARQLPLDEVEIERVRDFAAEAAEVAWRLAEILSVKLEEAGQDRLLREMEMPLARVLASMERTGVRIDSDYLREMSGGLQKELGTLEKEIHELAGGPFNVNSPQQLGQILFDRMGLESKRRTAKTRSRSTSQGALEELARDHDLPRLVLEYRALAKLKSTYVDALPALADPGTGRVHTSFNQTVAATGRLSSSDPNLQNIPIRTERGRRIRRAFVPEEGWRLLTADYSQVELRILAHMSDDPTMKEAFTNGEDIHRATAARILGLDLEEVTPDMRGRAKAINFGIIYGMSAARLAREQRMERAEAQQFIHDYFEHFDGVKAFIDTVTDEAKRTGKVQTLFGRVRYLPDLRSPNPMVRQAAERAAVNTPIQGTAADLIKTAMLAVDRGLGSGGFEARMLLQVHDELVLEVPGTEVEAVRRLVVECMEGACSLSVPLSVDTGVGDNWLEAK